MKAVIFPGDRKLEFLEFPDSTPGPGEVVLEIKASGMCGSDLKHYRASGGAASQPALRCVSALLDGLDAALHRGRRRSLRRNRSRCPCEIHEVSGAGDTVTRDVSNDLLRRQVTLIRSWTSTVGQADCARYIADRGIDVDRLFTHRWKLDQAEEAYQLFDKQTSGKGVILPS